MSAMLDTQMADYGSDIDVFMQPHSDPWAQDDGTMDDDSFNLFNETEARRTLGMEPMAPSHTTMPLPAFSGIPAQKEFLSLSREASAVEIDMDEYSEESHEFDMLDDEETRLQEIQDVEVHDVQATGTTVDSSSQKSFSPSNGKTASPPEASSLDIPDPSHDLSHESHSPLFDSSQLPFTIQDRDVTSAAVHTPTPVESHSAPNLEEGTDAAAEETHEVHEPEHHDARLVSGLTEEPAQVEYTEPEVLEQIGVNDEFGASTEAFESEPAGLTAAHGDLQDVASVEGTESAIPDAFITGVTDDNLEEVAALSNPHEISDGVYIEPPPAVLIDVPSSGHMFSIFNRPSNSGHSTPSPEDSTVAEDPHVLLHDRPTLFYEPVFAVFEALRQEEPCYNSSYFQDAELLFEIPSLKLFLSEDNVYAREVSLHDLSTLHDSFGNGSPLRLQLRTQGPRFIVRYSELQDLLHRIDLADDQHITGEQSEEVSREVDTHVNAKGERASNEYQEQQQSEESFLHESVPTEQAGQRSPVVIEQLGDPDLPSDPSDNTHQYGGDLLEDGPQAADHDEYETEAPTIPESEQAEEGPEELVREQEFDITAHVEIRGGANDADDNLDQQASTEGGAAVEQFEEEYYEDEDSETTETPGDDYADPEQATGAAEEEEEEGQGELDTNPDPEHVPEGEVSLVPLQSLVDSLHHPDIDHLSKVESVTGDASSGHSEQDLEAIETIETQDRIDSNLEAENGQVEETLDFTELPELPDDDEFWDDEQDGEGEIDASWDGEQDETISNESSITLSSKGSKRSHSEVEGEYDDGLGYLPSPDKRTRLE